MHSATLEWSQSRREDENLPLGVLLEQQQLIVELKCLAVVEIDLCVQLVLRVGIRVFEVHDLPSLELRLETGDGEVAGACDKVLCCN